MPTYNDLQAADPKVFATLAGEMRRQIEGVELIPSENYISGVVMEAMGNCYNLSLIHI